MHTQRRSFFTDASPPVGGWTTILVGASEYQVQRIVDVGGGVLIAYGLQRSGGGYVSLVMKSTDNGVTWVVITPVTPASALPFFAQFLHHILSGGVLRLITATTTSMASVAKLVSPWNTFELETAVYSGGGFFSTFQRVWQMPSGSLVAAATLQEPVTMAPVRPGWLVWTDDLQTWFDCEVV
jgi:hypothetical protein